MNPFCTNCDCKCVNPTCRRYLEWKDRQNEENYVAKRRTSLAKRFAKVMRGQYTGKAVSK